MIKENLLWGTIIDNDGKLQTELTFVGSWLAIVIGSAIAISLFFVIAYLFAAL